jgi:hypothetical protein
MAESGRVSYSRIWENLLRQNLGASVTAESGRVSYSRIWESLLRQNLGEFDR